MKVFDCFPFFREADLLDIRFYELDPVVDFFVISEGNMTHSGKPKDLVFPELLASGRYDKYKSKIIYLECDLSKESTAWGRENLQRNYILEGLSSLKDDDLVMVSDADEIPARKYVLAHKLNTNVPILVSRQYFFYYNFKYMKPELCHGTTSIYGKYLKRPQDLRNSRFTDPYIPCSGWHMSFYGSPEDIATKIMSFAHTEFGKEEFCVKEEIVHKINNGLDIFNRPKDNLIGRSPIVILPSYVMDNKELFKDKL